MTVRLPVFVYTQNGAAVAEVEMSAAQVEEFRATNPALFESVSADEIVGSGDPISIRIARS